MEDMDEGFEEGSEGEHNAEGRGSSGPDLEVVVMTLITGLNQGRKRTRAALKSASSSKISAKKTRAITPPTSAPLKVKSAINKHFYSKTAELRMVELIDKPISAKNRITQESLEQYKVMELLLGMGCVESALFPKQFSEDLVKEFYANLTKEFGNHESPAYGHTHLLYAFSTEKKINICTVIFKNILMQMDQKKTSRIALPRPYLITEYLLGCRDLSMPFDSGVRH
ncbi:hypothetical protein M9H77_02587 [Catharanthus roseus]|uniref:Uncharacterized protein n=1 Tax=Catharanthus roseus TaxID=4058 RepID=A0ACC0C8Y7_CATRO|nr:hypothetical protein M9H77_02587 [Catharanthus roseus]